MSNERQRILDRVKKLFQLTHKNATVGEVENAMRMAKRLMDQYNLTDADVQAKAKAGTLECVEREAASRAAGIEIFDQLLVNAACYVFGVRGFFKRRHDESTAGKTRTFTCFYGLEADVMAAVMFYNSVRMQMRVLARSRCGKGWTRAHVDYSIGFASGLTTKAQQYRFEQSRRPVGVGLAIDKDSLLNKYEKERFGRNGLRAPRKRRPVTVKNQAAMLTGNHDGHAVDIGPDYGGGQLTTPQKKLT